MWENKTSLFQVARSTLCVHALRTLVEFAARPGFLFPRNKLWFEWGRQPGPGRPGRHHALPAASARLPATQVLKPVPPARRVPRVAASHPSSDKHQCRLKHRYLDSDLRVRAHPMRQPVQLDAQRPELSGKLFLGLLLDDLLFERLGLPLRNGRGSGSRDALGGHQDVGEFLNTTTIGLKVVMREPVVLHAMRMRRAFTGAGSGRAVDTRGGWAYTRWPRHVKRPFGLGLGGQSSRNCPRMPHSTHIPGSGQVGGPELVLVACHADRSHKMPRFSASVASICHDPPKDDSGTCQAPKGSWRLLRDKIP
jgi:hypothetical protein